ncbi:hypothetical protein AMJ49_04145 [Parcubacteria bacterium DG_74_2]|nr:MAG: hypothetical protein AMJ49_04145 [Parcubacteria bacterium DG_74_2]
MDEILIGIAFGFVCLIIGMVLFYDGIKISPIGGQHSILNVGATIINLSPGFFLMILGILILFGIIVSN